MSLISLVGVVMALAIRPFVEPFTSEELTLSLWSVPAIITGVFLARTVKNHVEPRFLRRALLTLSAVSAIGLILRAAFA